MRVASGALLLFGAALAGAGCRTAPVVSAPTAPKVVATQVRTDAAGLAKFVVLPRPPLRLTWQQTQIGDGNFGPSDARLLAVMEFSSKDAAQIEAAALQIGAAKVEEIEVPAWFPSEVRKLAKRGADGRFTLRAAKADAAQFAHLSLSNGFVARVKNTNCFVLSLFST